MSTTDAGASPAVERGVRAHAPERTDFEAWLMREQGLTATWNPERNCYDEFPAHLAFKAWRAARPNRDAMSKLIQLAAECAQRKPLRGLEPLTEVTHIGHRQFGRAYAEADEAVRLLACALRDVADAL